MKYVSMIMACLVVLIMMVGCSKPVKYEAVADFDNDGNDDILTVEVRKKSSYYLVSIAFGEGDSFLKAVPILKVSREIMREISEIKCSDNNGDGNVDLILGNYQTQAGGRIRFGTSWVIYGNGDGTFQEEKGVEAITQ